MVKRGVVAVFAAALLLALASCDRAPQRIVLRGATMGTSWSVIYAEPPSPFDLPPQALQSLIEKELLAINQALSTYIPDSEISRINGRDTSGAAIKVSPLFAKVFEEAIAVGALTGGAYDVTVGPLIDLWGFGAPVKTPKPPTSVQIEATRARVGVDQISWDPEALVLIKPAGVGIDLSSIAKGYAVDQLSRIVGAQGIANSLVEIGGELRAAGERPEGGPWRLAVESPDPSQLRFIEALSLGDAAVATSGDYRNYFEFEGQRYSHLVDPRTGYPVAHDLVSVTVIDTQCMRADALATALLVLGLDAALRLAESQGIAAHFVSQDGDQLKVQYTESFEPYRQSTVAAQGAN